MSKIPSTGHARIRPSFDQLREGWTTSCSVTAEARISVHTFIAGQGAILVIAISLTIFTARFDDTTQLLACRLEIWH